MFENLNQPYPFNNNFKHNLRTITFVCMGFMLIALYFQPFGINFLASPKDGYFILAIGLISAAIFFINNVLLPGMLPKLFKSEKWTVRKELLWNVWLFALLITAFTLTAKAFGLSSMDSLMFFRSGALALLPIILFNLVNYNNSLKTKVTQVFDSGRQWINEEMKNTQGQSNEIIKIVSDNGKDVFEGSLKNLVLIQSASNYVEIYYREGHAIKKKLIRQTLNNVEKLLSTFTEIKKCHRCCLVNTKQISRITGNSPNYTLEADGLDFGIPISRQNIAKFKKIFSSR